MHRQKYFNRSCSRWLFSTKKFILCHSDKGGLLAFQPDQVMISETLKIRKAKNADTLLQKKATAYKGNPISEELLELCKAEAEVHHMKKKPKRKSPETFSKFQSNVRLFTKKLLKYLIELSLESHKTDEPEFKKCKSGELLSVIKDLNIIDKNKSDDKVISSSITDESMTSTVAIPLTDSHTRNSTSYGNDSTKCQNNKFDKLILFYRNPTCISSLHTFKTVDRFRGS